MKRFTTLLALLMVVALSAVFMFAGCSSSSDDAAPTPEPTTGPGRIMGVITDESGVPLRGATVSLSHSGVQSSDVIDRNLVNTDENGAFIFEDLSTGIQYSVTVRYDGRVTVVTMIELTEEITEKAFKLFLPMGEGTASFSMPSGASLNTPVRTGRDVELTWNMGRTSSLNFHSNILYRKATPTVTTDDTLVFETTSVVELSTTDTFPSEGRWYYRLFTCYMVDGYNIKVMLGSNEVQAYLDKYVFGMRWDEEDIPVINPSPDPSLDPSPTMTPVNFTQRFPFSGDRQAEEYPHTALYKTAVYDDGAGNKVLYVTDPDQGSVFKIVNDGDVEIFYQSDYVDTTRQEGPGYIWPIGIAVDKSGRVYVSDAYYGQILVFSPNGEWIASTEMLTNNKTRGRGAADSIAVYDNGTTQTVYFNDYRYIFRTTFNGESFTIPTLWKEYSSSYPTYNYLTSLAVDSSGNVYVGVLEEYDYLDANAHEVNGYYYNARIDKFASGGAILNKIYGSEMEGGNFYFVTALAVDKNNNLFAADTNSVFRYGSKTSSSTDSVSRIMEFDADGNYITKFGQYGQGFPYIYLEDRQYNEDGELTLPMGLAVDQDRSVYVSDVYGVSIQKFVLDLETDQ